MKDTEAIIAERKAEAEAENLDAIKRDICHARQWARDRWKDRLYVDEETTPSTLLDPARVKLEFPGVDTMRVSPVTYGESMWAGSSEYRLCWREGRLYWVGNFSVRVAFGKQPDEIKLYVGLARGKP